MKNTKIFFIAWTILISLFLSSSSLAQTDSYSCNVICLNQPDYVFDGVQVDLYDHEGQFLETTYTDSEGFFHFQELEIGKQYTAKFSYDASNDFVDISDAISLLYYLFGYIEFDEAQIIAANVNGDNQVNFGDFFTILFNYYILQQPFPVGDWILPDWEFQMTADKATGGPSGGIASGNLNNDVPDKDFYQIAMDYADIVAFENEEVVVPVYFNDKVTVSGAGIVFAYNNELFEITKIESSIQNIQYNVLGGTIRVAWANEKPSQFSTENPILNIHLKQKYYTNEQEIESLKLMEGTHILNEQGQKTPFVGLVSNEFKTASIGHLGSNRVYPNPCADHVFVTVPEGVNNVDVKMYNTLGQIVLSKSYTAVHQQIEIQTQGLQNGQYYYQINYLSKSISGPLSIRN